ncbi:MAG TPA: preprotein translocase subunit SecE [Desulfobulbus sp.]|nr:preprotein translocase subunit SecE [Desulfobulbus sp.]
MASKKKTRSGKARQVEATAGPERSPFSPSAIRDFIHEVQAEFKKIVWPSRKVTSGLTVFVIVLVIILAIYLGSVDLLLGKLVSFILK